MNNQFDELTKQMAQSVTRRGALKKFGVGLAGLALACFGLANSARAGTKCNTNADCSSSEVCRFGACVFVQKCQANSDCHTLGFGCCRSGVCSPFYYCSKWL